MRLRHHHFIDEHLPDAWLYEDCILYIDHEHRLFLARGFVVHGHPMSNLSAEHLASWRSAAMSMLNSLEISTHLDFFWVVENDYSQFLEGHRQGADAAAPALALNLLSERIHDFEDRQLRNDLHYRKLFVFVNFAPVVSKLGVNEKIRRRFNAERDHRILLREWKAARQKLDQLTDMARHPFESSGMNTVLLAGKNIRHLVRKMLSPLRSRMRVPEPENKGHLWTETLVSDIERKPPFLYFDDHFHAFISMTNLPQDTRTGFLLHLFNLSHPDYTLTVTLRPTDKQTEIKNLQSDYGSKKGLQKSRERQGKITNIEMETQAEELAQEIRVLTQTPQQIFECQLILHLWNADANELQRRVDEAVLKSSYCNGIQATLENIAAPEALRACLPGWTRETRLDRFQALKSVNAADFIPAHTDFIGTGRPQLLFPTPQDGLMTAHVYTASRPFHNVVVGESGGGKTFLVDSVITQLVSQGLKSVSVISTKDEFGPLMAIYGGEKISFTEENPVFLNPCAIIGSQPTEDEMEVLTTILETIFGEEPNDTARNVRESRIHHAARLAFEKYGSETRLHHFVEAFRTGWDDNLEELKKLAIILEPYARGGLYGEYFDSDTRKPLDLSNPFKFFDFSRIKKKKNLSAVMMMALTTGEALRLAKTPRHWRKALVLDECWAFVNSATGGDFIENALRIYRAYNAAVFLCSQVISDFTNSKISDVIETNVHNYFLLRTISPKAVTALKEECHLTDELASRFAAMPNPDETGYSHFIYVHKAESSRIMGEGINRVSRPEALLYSTSPNISQLRDHLLKQNSDPWEAVCKLAEMSDEQLHNETAKLFYLKSPTPKE